MSNANIVTTLILVLTLTIAACSSSTGPGSSTPEPDSASWVIDSLELAYVTRNLDLYMSCFRADFVFHLAYSSQPPVSWGYDTEEEYHENMFTYVDSIELEFWGDDEFCWSGDPTGQSYVLLRDFDLKVYYSIPGSLSVSSEAAGSVDFICRTDANNEWYVWQWYDMSEVKWPLTWTDIKRLFSQAI
jgi:hypothetical protein